MKQLLSRIDLKKILIRLLPYLIIAYFFDKISWLYRLTPQDQILYKLIYAISNIQYAFHSFLPSFHPIDLLFGAACGAAFRIALYVFAPDFAGENGISRTERRPSQYEHAARLGRRHVRVGRFLRNVRPVRHHGVAGFRLRLQHVSRIGADLRRHPGRSLFELFVDVTSVGKIHLIGPASYFQLFIKFLM